MERTTDRTWIQLSLNNKNVKQGDHRNVSRPLARIHSTNQHTQTQTTKVRLIKVTF